MKPLTYRQLKDAVNEMTEEMLDQSVSLLDTSNNEVYSAYETTLVSELPDKVRDEVEDAIGLDAAVITFCHLNFRAG